LIRNSSIKEYLNFDSITTVAATDQGSSVIETESFRDITTMAEEE